MSHFPWHAPIGDFYDSKSFYINKYLNGHHFIDVNKYTALTQKAILSVVLHLTELMDKTIKSLKGSTHYRDEDKTVLINRFVQLLKPYYDLMSCWINTVPSWQINRWYFWTDDYRFYGNEMLFRENMLEEIKNALYRSDRKAKDLFPSEKVSIASCKFGSGVNFVRQFTNHIDEITFEDLFSLIHQNILSAVSNTNLLLFRDTTLPRELMPLFEEFTKKGKGADVNASFELLSIQKNHPVIILQYNLTMQNHGAAFYIEYNQKTKEVTLHGLVFGDGSDRMIRLGNALNIAGLVLGVAVRKPPVYDPKKLAMDFIWTFPCSFLQNNSGILARSFLSFNRVILRMTDFSYSAEGPYDLMTRHPSLLQDFVTKKRFDLLSTADLCERSSNSPSPSIVLFASYKDARNNNLAALLENIDPESIALVMNIIAESNKRADTLLFFKKLKFLNEPKKDQNRDKIASILELTDKSSCSNFKSLVAELLPKSTSEGEPASRPGSLRP